MNYIDFTKAPKKIHNNNIVIDWLSFNNEELYFEYRGKSGIIKISFYEETRKYVYKMKCEYEGKISYIYNYSLKECKLSSIVNKKVYLFDKKYIHDFVYNKEDLKKYTINSSKKIMFQCPSCKEKGIKKIQDVMRQGFSCGCKKGSSYNERLVSNILDYFNIKYEREKTYEKLISDKGRYYRFDFYLPKHNAIIETHGKQHYNENNFYGKGTKKSDKIKRRYCEDKNIRLYEIDCSNDTTRDKNIKCKLEEIAGEYLEEDVFIDLKMKSIHFSRVDKSTIISMYKRGYSQKEISQSMNISLSIVQKITKNIKKEGSGRYDNQIIDLRTGEVYKNLEDVYKSFDFSQKIKTVKSNIHENMLGVPTRNGRMYLSRRKYLTIGKNKDFFKKIIKNIKKDNKSEIENVKDFIKFKKEVKYDEVIQKFSYNPAIQTYIEHFITEKDILLLKDEKNNLIIRVNFQMP